MVKTLMSLVNPGTGDTRASPCSPASMFSREDLPTFERPMKANSGSVSSGHESRSGALQSNMADEMFTLENPRSSTYQEPCRKKGQFNPVCKNIQTPFDVHTQVGR